MLGFIGKRVVGAGLLAGALGLAPATGLAARATDTLLEEVLVYGTKTSAAQDAQDVSGQVTAYGSDQLEAMHVFNIEDLSFVTPNVQLDGVGTQPSYAAFSIRGLGVDNSIPSTEPNVGVFVDGTYMGQPFGVITDTFDLESVEIHKGPQGLLFGRNVTGGAVLLRSRRPTGDSGISGKVGVETGTQYAAAFAMEGATEDGKVAGRLAFQLKKDEGWFDNETINDNTGASTNKLGRLSLLFKSDEGAETTLILERGGLSGDGVPVQGNFLSGVAPEGVEIPENLSQYDYRVSITPQTDKFEVTQDHVGAGDINWSQYTLETQVDTRRGHLTNLLSFREVDAFSTTDVDGLPSAAIVTFYTMDQEQVTFESRYNITLFDRWDLTAGLYYFEQEYDYTTGLVVRPSSSYRQLFDPEFGTSTGHRRGGGALDQTTISLYMNNEFRLTDDVALFGGLNLSQEEKEVGIHPRLSPGQIAMGTDEFKNSPYANACDFVTGCDFSRAIRDEDTWVNIAPKIGAKWQANDDMQVYGHISSAFRSGFWNFRQTETALLLPGPNAKGPEPTEEEEHYAVEAGIKSHFWDRRLRLNAAVFMQDIKNLARSTGFTLPPEVDPEQPSAQDLITVGDARITGLELELQALPVDNLLVQFALGLLDGEITEARANINRSGDDLINDLDEALDLVRLSDVTANVDITYDMPQASGNLFTITANFAHRSEAAASDDNRAYFPKLTMVNADLSYGAGDGSWKFSLYGRNLGNEVVYRTVFPISNWRVFAPLAEGRRFGLEFSYEF